MADPDTFPASLVGLAGGIYRRVLCTADWMHAHARLVAMAGAPLVTLLLVGINQFILLDFPNSGDEYVYLYQARTLADGRLWNPASPLPQVFAFNYIVHEPGRVFGTFPPGWPLMLALALWLQVPVWLVNPVLGTLTLGLSWRLGTRLYGPRVGALAATLVGVSPFFLFNAASYFSHTFCGVLLLGAAVLAARDDRAPAWVPVVAGLLVGWAVVTRYLTGVVCGVPIALWLLRPGAPRARTAVLFALGGLPWALGLMAYNTALSGSPWQLTTTPLTLSLWFRDGFILRGADILSTHLLRHLLWTPPALLVVYLVALRRAPRDLRRGWLDWMPLLMAAVLYFYVERGGNQYGPRFHYEVFLFFVLVAVAYLVREPVFAGKGRLDQALFLLMVVSVAVLPLSFAAHAVIEQEVIRERMDPFRLAQQSRLRNALVLISGRVGTERSMGPGDLTRNSFAHDGPVLYGRDAGSDGRCGPGERLPGRVTYLYQWDPVGERGQLRPLDCPEGAAATRAQPATRSQPRGD